MEPRVGTYTSEDGLLQAKVTIWPAYMTSGPCFGCHDAEYEVPEEIEIEPKDSPLRQEILDLYEDGLLELS